MQISDDDKNLAKYFGLDYFKNNGSPFLGGALIFNASYNKKDKKYTVFKQEHKDHLDKFLIKDTYEIRINLSAANIYRAVSEVSSKINRAAKAKGLPVDNLHKDEKTGGLCIVGYFNEKDDISFQNFLKDAVIPFFYDQSFFSKFGKWPRGQYSHGCLGILENYYEEIKNQHNDTEIRDLTEKCISFLNGLSANMHNQFSFNSIKNLISKKKIRNHWNCITCSRGKFPLQKVGKRSYRRPKGNNFINCHLKSFLAMRMLHKNVNRFKLNNKFANTKNYENLWTVQYIRQVAPRYFKLFTILCAILLLS